MKKYSLFFKLCMVALVVTGGFGFQACDDDDTYYYYYGDLLPNALVTVKNNADETFYLQLDDSTTLLPTNMTVSPFGGKEVRALVNYNLSNQPAGAYDKAVHINWIDSLLTKQMAPDFGEKNDSVYGNDPVEMVRDWVTIAEDGYLTLRFRTRWTGGAPAHYVNLLAAPEEDNAYVVEFRHNAYGDVNGTLADGLVAFRLNDLPDTDGATVKLKLKWQSFSGEKTAEFDYCSRRSTTSSTSSDIASERSVILMK